MWSLIVALLMVDKAQGTLCFNTCLDSAGVGYSDSARATVSSDGVCNDGGPGSEYSMCDLGTDCTDCTSEALAERTAEAVAMC